MKKIIDKIHAAYLYCLNWVKIKWKELITPVSIDDKIKETITLINPNFTISQPVDSADYILKSDFVKAGDICV